MMKGSVLCALFIFAFYSPTFGQDTIPLLQEVMVKGFGTGSRQIAVPASIGVISERDLQRYGNVSLVPVMNTVPGVRMEERSPGSYRLSIRGSLLRSPFGVRNVKVYWKDMPLTDAGGNTYLNILDLNSIGGAEILKGPAGSMYGAGTGGVVTFSESAWLEERRHAFSAQINAGSYGLFGASVNWKGNAGPVQWQATQSHLQSDGYRQNSRMRRDVSQIYAKWKINEKDQLEALVLYGNLNYRTPGGLTLAQMNANPRQARPATPALPSAVQQKAGVYNKSLFAGLTNSWQISNGFSNVTSVIFSHTDFENPFITNYEKRNEQGIAARTSFNHNWDWNGTLLKVSLGGELQRGNAVIDSTGNNGGVPNNKLVRDNFKVRQQFLFTHAELTLAKKLVIQAGLSWNGFTYDLQRTIPLGSPATIKFDDQLLPRVALLYRALPSISIHGSVSKGYSAPTLAEIRPSAGGIYSDLQAESGWNYELGLKGRVLHSRLSFDLSVFRFNLDNAIVRRNTAAGAEYFVNAGSTRQDGLEGLLEWYVVSTDKGFIRQVRTSLSASIFNFHFSDYKVGSADYSGNELTGVPGEVVVAGIDVISAPGIYFNLSFNYTSAIPLTDQNDVYSVPYRLWQGRAGWRKKWKHNISTDIFIGIDNAADELYSLGNDINAFGKRYYNPAASRNYYGGVRFSF